MPPNPFNFVLRFFINLNKKRKKGKRKFTLILFLIIKIFFYLI